MSSGETHIYEEGKFFGCYLLRSLNVRYKGSTYIGFTVNPNRRIKQHNSGYMRGGAKRTSGKGPWEMCLIVHGFPNEISALRFEWAWTYPEKSLRLKHLVPKTRQFNFVFKFNVLCEMLRIGPWCRLPLTIRWLKQEYRVEFPLSKLPPPHMPIEFGLVQILSNKKKKQQALPSQSQMSGTNTNENCFICKKILYENDEAVANKMKCLKCMCPFHTLCIAERFLASDSDKVHQLLPIDGDCPKCMAHLMWGDLVRFRMDDFKVSVGWSTAVLEDSDDDESSEDFVEKDDGDDDAGDNLEPVHDFDD